MRQTNACLLCCISGTLWTFAESAKRGCSSSAYAKLAVAGFFFFVLQVGRRERKREGDGEFSKRHRKCGREARGAPTLKALLILSSVQR